MGLIRRLNFQGNDCNLAYVRYIGIISARFVGRGLGGGGVECDGCSWFHSLMIYIYIYIDQWFHYHKVWHLNIRCCDEWVNTIKMFETFKKQVEIMVKIMGVNPPEQ